MKFTREQQAMAQALYDVAPNGRVPVHVAIVWVVKAVCYILVWIANVDNTD